MNYYLVALIRTAVATAMPRMTADKAARWADLLVGLIRTAGTAIVAPSTAKASNIARRAWKASSPLKGSVAVPLARWTYDDLLVKQSTATATVDGMRVAVTNGLRDVTMALRDIAPSHLVDDLAVPAVAVSLDPHNDGIVVTGYWHTVGSDE
jgi:hypothetical protein